MMRGVGSDIKAGTTVLGNVTKKGATKGINLTNSYLNKTTKAMAGQPKKLVVANAVATGSLEFSSEASDYIVGNKGPTADNFMRSGVNISVAASKGAGMAGMPVGVAVGTDMVMSKITEGDYKVKETTQKNIVSEAVENYLPKNGYTPALRELINKGVDILSDYTEGNENEKK
ncbi:hypothetical protein [Phocoenobacter skyensis]|uniref:hypothetical protein n=1 Tax=Phocoenobacter skyensis TaxID=97481 RepID=UPI00276DECB7|nr:hypothetical protein [Pasteurella skyensis]MDP8185338.1 hypothetical protein [Pasteurella skyensis]